MLNYQQLHSLVPSAFTTKPDPKVTNKYQYVSTLDFLEQAEKVGFYPIQARQSASPALAYARHKITLRNPQFSGTKEYTPELIWINSHNRTSCAALILGIHRFFCENGLYVGINFSGFKFKHLIGNAYNMQDHIQETLESWPRIENTINRWQETPMSLETQENYATIALGLKYPKDPPFDPTSLLRTRRQEDMPETLWHTYNKVQENLLKGWQKWNRPRGISRRIKNSPVKSIDKEKSINEKLWDLTLNFQGIAH